MRLLTIELTKDEFNRMIELVKAAGEHDQFLKGVMLSCDNCGAVIVKAPTLLVIIDQLITFMDSNDISHLSSDAQRDLDDILWEIREMMLRRIILTDDEWERYLIAGQSAYQFAHDTKGELITDSDGNPHVFVAVEVLFEFDKQCECTRILNPLIEPN